MTSKPSLVFACAHMTDERLYAAQLAVLQADYNCHVFVFREHDTMGAMAAELLSKSPSRFTLIGLSLGGYVAFEVIRRELHRIERLVLIDTTAKADHAERMQGRLNDIAKVRNGGIKALSPELPARWLLPAHMAKPDLVMLMDSMAHSVGAKGQFNQQTAMLARPDSHKDLQQVAVPALVMCGRQDLVTPLADHEAISACIPGAQLQVIESCGHLSTIEQPDAVNAVLKKWLLSTA